MNRPPMSSSLTHGLLLEVLIRSNACRFVLVQDNVAFFLFKVALNISLAQLTHGDFLMGIVIML